MYVLDPRSPPVGPAESETFDLDRPLADVVVGLRLDHSWRSYMAVVEEWTALLGQDGASAEVLWTGERVGAEGETTRDDLGEWSRLIDCGVIGLGN